jgi:hemoglobin-like flavoprotein
MSSSNGVDGGHHNKPDNAADVAMQSLKTYNDLPLTNPDICMAMQIWNKTLAFSTSFSEAVVLHWRLLVAAEGAVSNKKAYRLVETNKDLLAKLLGERIHESEALIMGLLDTAIRSICPQHQMVQREAYRPMGDTIHMERLKNTDPGEIFHFECETVADYLKVFARLGVPPDAWVKFVRACSWAFATHIPYAKEDDTADIESGVESAILRAVTQKVAIPAIETWKELSELASNPVVAIALPRFWDRFDKAQLNVLGESIYRTLFTEHPFLTDYFARTDMDSLAMHLIQALKVIFRSADSLTAESGPFRTLMKHLGDVHLALGVPSYAYPLIGKSIIDSLMPYMIEEETKTADGPFPAKASELKAVFMRLYSEVMSLVYAPVIRYEKMLKIAREFYDKVAVELNWGKSQLERRMIEIEKELAATGTYTQTGDEIQIGARLAWRNSAKCIGRISWNTLQVRDCRHVTDPEGIFREVEEHMKIATAGTNIQSVMTVFRPLSPKETVGPRFWTHQCVRYAGYRDPTVCCFFLVLNQSG